MGDKSKWCRERCIWCARWVDTPLPVYTAYTSVSFQALVVLPWECTTRTSPSGILLRAPSRWPWPRAGPCTSAPRTLSWKSMTVASKTSSRRSTRSEKSAHALFDKHSPPFRPGISHLRSVFKLLLLFQGVPGPVWGQRHLVWAPADRWHGGPGHEIWRGLHLGLQELRWGRTVWLGGTRLVKKADFLLWLPYVKNFFLLQTDTRRPLFKKGGSLEILLKTFLRCKNYIYSIWHGYNVLWYGNSGKKWKLSRSILFHSGNLKLK